MIILKEKTLPARSLKEENIRMTNSVSNLLDEHLFMALSGKFRVYHQGTPADIVSQIIQSLAESASIWVWSHRGKKGQEKLNQSPYSENVSTQLFGIEKHLKNLAFEMNRWRDKQ
jgi:hypothetical protein